MEDHYEIIPLLDQTFRSNSDKPSTTFKNLYMVAGLDDYSLSTLLQPFPASLIDPNQLPHLKDLEGMTCMSAYNYLRELEM